MLVFWLPGVGIHVIVLRTAGTPVDGGASWPGDAVGGPGGGVEVTGPGGWTGAGGAVLMTGACAAK